MLKDSVLSFRNLIGRTCSNVKMFIRFRLQSMAVARRCIWDMVKDKPFIQKHHLTIIV